MAEESQDDKTEEPTARRLEKAKEDGQVLRSQDMTIAAVTGSVIAALYLGGFWIDGGSFSLGSTFFPLRSPKSLSSVPLQFASNHGTSGWRGSIINVVFSFGLIAFLLSIH